LGTRINKFRLFYSYDIALEDFQKYNNGSHELSISFEIPSNIKGNSK
jgi:Type IX secretion system membrane protein PorP/SprF